MLVDPLLLSVRRYIFYKKRAVQRTGNKACPLSVFKVLRVILQDARYRHSSTVEITKGSNNESWGHPRDIFRPAIGQSAFAFVLVQNHPGEFNRNSFTFNTLYAEVRIWHAKCL